MNSIQSPTVPLSLHALAGPLCSLYLASFVHGIFLHFLNTYIYRRTRESTKTSKLINKPTAMAERPKLRHSQHGPSWASVSTYHTIQEEVRLHSNYIRDTVAPLLAQERRLSDSDTHLMQSILQRIKTLPVTLDLLQYSRMEKALMVITADGELNWPIAIVEQAKGILKEWEEDLGPLQNIRADLFAIGGRLEGVTRTTYWTSGASYENSVSVPFQSSNVC